MGGLEPVGLWKYNLNLLILLSLIFLFFEAMILYLKVNEWITIHPNDTLSLWHNQCHVPTFMEINYTCGKNSFAF